MKTNKWEYHHMETVDSDDMETVLDNRGDSGWELVSTHRRTVRITDPEDADFYVVVVRYAVTMKRPQTQRSTNK